MKTQQLTFSALACGTTLLLSMSASAHIALDFPTQRHESMNDIKTEPCGPAGGSTRTTDPSRITTFEPGETITVEWHETINHASHYRIAFDDDGQDDFPTINGPDDIVDPPTLPILLDGIPDKTSATDTFAVEVTLPNITCDNCTIQLIQYMYDRAEPFYYVCADIALEGDLVGGSGGADGAGGSEGLVATGGAEGGDPLPSSGGADMGSGGAGAGGAASGGAVSSGGALSSGGSTAAPMTGGAATTDGMTMDEWMDTGTGSEEGGKGCSVAGALGGGAPFGALAFLGSALSVALARRRRTRG